MPRLHIILNYSRFVLFHIKYMAAPVAPEAGYRCHILVVQYNNVKTSVLAPQMTSLTILYSTVYSGAQQRNHQSSASLASVRGIHRWPVNSPYKGPQTWKILPFDDVLMIIAAVNGYVVCEGGHCPLSVTLQLLSVMTRNHNTWPKKRITL